MSNLNTFSNHSYYLIHFICSELDKNVYFTTLSKYKDILEQWYKGTGGGSAFASMFETWSEEKLLKYNINQDEYDHIKIQNRPKMLMEGYAKKKQYLTCIFMRDNIQDC